MMRPSDGRKYFGPPGAALLAATGRLCAEKVPSFSSRAETGWTPSCGMRGSSRTGIRT